jgi:tellurite methyltransferase
MPLEDANRWNQRYSQGEPFKRPPNIFLKENIHLLPKEGYALDLAMGVGNNAGFLLDHGLNVLGVDISTVAALRARKKNPGLEVIVADLTQFWLPEARFDVIINIRYVERTLWTSTSAALKPGGLLFFEGLHIAMRGMASISDPSHLLAEKELMEGFNSLDILEYYEGWIQTSSGKEMAVSRLIARKNTS